MYPNRVARGDPWGYNGCGSTSYGFQAVNDAGTYLTGFGDMCNNHDLCYSSCGETQQTCDDEFRAMMYSKCNRDHDTIPGKEGCKKVSDGMYKIVEKLGGDIFDDSQRMALCV